MEVVVPELGDFSDVEIIEVLVSEGDEVKPEDPLITLETDKATMEVPSPAGGIVKGLKVAVGDRVSAGNPILELDDASDPDKVTTGSDATEATGTPPGDGTEEPAPGSSPGPVLVKVPDLGDFSDVEIIEVLVGEGDEVEGEQGLITLETEKAVMDVPSPAAGRVLELKVQTADRVSAGDPVLLLQPTGEARAEPEPGAREEVIATRPVPPPAPERPSATGRGLPPVNEEGFSRAHASPSVRKLARELGVDLGRVTGTGRKGRVTDGDLKSWVKATLSGAGGTGLPALPDVDFASFGPIEVEPLGRIQRISGPRLQASWINLPHVTQHDEADITHLEEVRQELKGAAKTRGIRLTPLAFVIRACVLALEEYPRFRASLTSDGESLVLKRYCHIGFAADTPKGLVVPVIRDADRMDIYEIGDALGILSGKARESKLGPDDMRGGVFTISSLGGIGGTAFTPIINAPEVAILGVSRSRIQPVYRDAEFVPRLMLPLSLSYDHRVIDGAAAVRFTTYLGEALGQVDRLLEPPSR